MSSPARLFPSIFPKHGRATLQAASSVRNLSGEIEKVGLETDDDEEAMLRLQEHNIDALGFLYRRYARIVYSICTRILRNPTEAEDAVHEIFLCIFRRCGSFDPRKGKARSWIIGFAYSKCFDWRDKLISRDRLVDPEAAGSVSNLAVQRNGQDPAYTIVWNARMLAAFKSLSKEQQRALMLFYFQGLTFQEIAKQQGCSHGNAKNHVYRGIERLRSIVVERAARKAIPPAVHEEKCESQEMAE